MHKNLLKRKKRGKGSHMEKRAFERISTNIYVRFFCGRILQTGIITNLSRNGMRINNRVCIPSDSKFDVLIIGRGADLKIPVKVNRLIESKDIHRGIGVELLEQPLNYSVFVDSLRSFLFVQRHPLSTISGQVNDTITS